MSKLRSAATTLMQHQAAADSKHVQFEPATNFPAVVQESKDGLAFDAAPYVDGFSGRLPIVIEDQQFKGYPYLASLYQNGLIGSIVDVLATDTTREGIVLHSVDEAAQAKITTILDRLTDLRYKSVLKDAMIKNLLFGGAGIFLDIAKQDAGPELAKPLRMSSAKISKDRPLTRLVVVEPYFCVGVEYNSSNPLSKDWYNPEYFMVVGQKVHRSRFMKLVYTKPPTMYLPRYNFFGIPLVQQIEEYVLRFEKTTTYINEIMQRMRTIVYSTNLGDMSEESNKTQEEMLSEAMSFKARLDLLANQGSNIGIAVIDKETEEITEINSSLSELSNILSSMAEQMCIVPKIPATRLLGLSPQGFNATGEFDMKNYFNTIAQIQESNLRDALQTVIDIICVEQFGDIDRSITFDFKPLQALDETQMAELQRSMIDQVSALFSTGLITKDEARKTLAKNELLNIEIDPDAEFEDEDDGDVIDSKLDGGNTDAEINAANEAGSSDPSRVSKKPEKSN